MGDNGIDTTNSAVGVGILAIGNDPTVEFGSTEVADLSQFSQTYCNSVVDADAHSLPVFNNVDDSSGLPLLKVNICGKSGSILLDTGSKLNLVSKAFLVDSLNINSCNIRETNVLVKGVSGNIFRAAGEIDLSFDLLGRNFTYTFVVLTS